MAILTDFFLDLIGSIIYLIIWVKIGRFKVHKVEAAFAVIVLTLAATTVFAVFTEPLVEFAALTTNILYIALLTVFAYKKTKVLSLGAFYSVTAAFIFIFSSNLSDIVMMILRVIPSPHARSYVGNDIILLVIAYLSTLAFAFITSHFVGKLIKSKMDSLDTIMQGKLALYLLGGTSVTLVLLFIHTFISNMITDVTVLGMFYALALMVYFVILIFTVSALSDKFQAEIKGSRLEEQAKHYEHQLQLANASESLIQKTKHDLTNLFVGLQADMREGNIDNAEKRIACLIGDINALEGPASSGNIAIDSIINFKAGVARELSAIFILDLKIPDNLALDSAAISLILGSALDNAVEAVEALEDKSKRVIQIFMSYTQETLFMQIKNPYEGKIHTDDKGVFLSQKRKNRERGVGLQSIGYATSGDSGSFEINYDENEFCLNVALYGIVQV